ncbi:hypothetical protein [Roseateles sp.]|uniref:hypothetical protein n=1 Tax=Roseateles sp. TaxID=1971397 RepID=UPI002E0B7D90|nr:hypothetical protein [Roseateles sp.]
MTTTHDYTTPKRRWGHDVIVTQVHDKGLRVDVMVFGKRIDVGDFLLVTSNSGGRVARYRVTSSKNLGDPRDMWRCTLEFASWSSTP